MVAECPKARFQPPVSFCCCSSYTERMRHITPRALAEDDAWQDAERVCAERTEAWDHVVREGEVHRPGLRRLTPRQFWQPAPRWPAVGDRPDHAPSGDQHRGGNPCRCKERRPRRAGRLEATRQGAQSTLARRSPSLGFCWRAADIQWERLAPSVSSSP